MPRPKYIALSVFISEPFFNWAKDAATASFVLYIGRLYFFSILIRISESPPKLTAPIILLFFVIPGHATPIPIICSKISLGRESIYLVICSYIHLGFKIGSKFP